jgi:hypothetical protein
MAGEQTKFTTSFIPKKPLTTTVSGYKTKSNFLTIIMVAIFLATVGAGVGIFLYKIAVQKQIDFQIADLKKSKEEFNPKFLKEAGRLNTKIITIKTLFDNHQAPSAIFDLIEKVTIETVRYDSFKYSKGKSDKAISLEASGVGLGYESIILQSDELGKTGSLKDTIFSSNQKNDDRSVGFSLKTKVEAALVLYRKTLSGDSANNTEEESKNVSFNNIFR